MKVLFLMLSLMTITSLANSQRRTPAPAPPATADTTKKAITGAPPTARSAPKPYREVITAKAITDSGLFILHKVEDKYYWEIRDSLMGRDFLSVSRISKAAAGMRSGHF